MKEILHYATHEILVYRRPRQRNINLRVRGDGRLSVSCSRGVSKREILGFVLEQEHFIKKCLSEIAEVRKKHPKKKFETGDVFLFEGAHLSLQMIWGWSPRLRVSHDGEKIEIVAPLAASQEDRQKALFNYYRRRAKNVLTERVVHWSSRMNLYPRSVSVRGQKTRWGSCSSNKELSLNWKLIAVPFHVMEYVLIHEIAHLKHMNHSPEFWALVAEHCPDFKSAKRWLREHEPELNNQFQKISNSL